MTYPINKFFPQRFSIKKMFLTIILAPFIGFGALILLIFSGIPYHNHQMSSFENNISEISIPDTQLIDTTREFGLLWGNSNHCDYSFTVYYSTELTQDQFISKINTSHQNFIPPFKKDGSKPTIFFYKDKQLQASVFGNEYEILEENNYNIVADWYLDSWEYNELVDIFASDTNVDYAVAHKSQSFNELDIATDARCN